MCGRTARTKVFSQLFGKCRRLLLAYCLIAIPLGVDCTLLAQSIQAGQSTAGDPADEDYDEVIESAAAEAILPALTLGVRLLAVRLPPQRLSTKLACHYSSTLSSLSCGCPTAGSMLRNGIGIPLRC